ncbi:MAG TPA: DUF6036 family nucleotidyltransferase [Nannocystaceae bacterium]|nr:DUF6036 family nucleotidyltransferase [Nannocystaceae bacterium]
MPAKRPDPAGADGPLEAALRAFAQAMDGTRAPWAIIGGLAVIVHGVRRLTTDVDAVVAGDRMSAAQALRALASRDVVPRIDDAEAFAQAHLVLLLRHRPSGVDIDLSFGWTEFERIALAKRDVAAFGKVEAPFVRPVDLVVYKGLAGRAKDLEDLAALLLLHRELDLVEARGRLAELAAVAEAPEILEGFDATVALVHPQGPGTEARRDSPSPKDAAKKRAKKSRR